MGRHEGGQGHWADRGMPRGTVLCIRMVQVPPVVGGGGWAGPGVVWAGGVQSTCRVVHQGRGVVPSGFLWGLQCKPPRTQRGVGPVVAQSEA